MGHAGPAALPVPEACTWVAVCAPRRSVPCAASPVGGGEGSEWHRLTRRPRPSKTVHKRQFEKLGNSIMNKRKAQSKWNLVVSSSYHPGFMHSPAPAWRAAELTRTGPARRLAGGSESTLRVGTRPSSRGSSVHTTAAGLSQNLPLPPPTAIGGAATHAEEAEEARVQHSSDPGPVLSQHGHGWRRQ